MSSTVIHPSPTPAAPPAPRPRPARRATPWPAWAALALITAGGAVLRLIDLGGVPSDPFYDAAVRSMSQSWHNFFFGVFEPGGSVSIDKPPVDLWLQVLSVKLFGFTPTALKLPEALAGVVSVPLVYAAVRRAFGYRSALAAALAMAVLPVEVVTARSDTMDAVMMALVALALLLALRALETGGLGWMLGAAAALGLAFDVKLLEALVPLPGLVAMVWLGLPGTPRRRLLALAAAGAIYAVVALSWLTATLLVPAHDRPFAIGSTNGSAWNAAFVFNGYDRIAGKANQSDPITYGAHRAYPTATQSQRDHIPITPPSVGRLLVRVGPLSGERLGLEVLAAVLFGVPAMWGPLRRRLMRRPATAAEDSALPDAHAPPPGRPPRERIAGAAAAGLLLWLATGIVLFSEMARLHPRYVEGFTPAVAAVLGVGLAWVTRGPMSPARVTLLAAGLAGMTVYAAHLLFGEPAAWWVMALATVACAGVAAAAMRTPRLSTPALILGLTAVLAVPVMACIDAISEKVSDAGHVGAIDAADLRRLGIFLRAHQGSARYEVASDSATRVGALIVQDGRPVLVLTTYDARTLTSVSRLRSLIAARQVKYALVSGGCGPHTARTSAACAPPVMWVRKHARDVSSQAGLSRAGMLWQLPGAVA